MTAAPTASRGWSQDGANPEVNTVARCGCAQDFCSCKILPGDGIAVTGAGSDGNPYVVTSTITNIETGFNVQVNDTIVATDIHQLDFRGAGVTIAPGADEAVVTIPGPTAGITTPVPPGVIWMFASTTPPSGWLLCDGQTVLVADHPDLFAAIGNKWGGDGVSDFAVPNLMDRFPIGASATKPIDSAPGGSETKSILTANLPPHAHTINHNHGAFNTGDAGAHDHVLELSNNDGTSGSIRRGTSSISTGTGPVRSSGAHHHSINVPAITGNSGSGPGTGAPMDIMPPWLALAFVIKT